MKLERLSVKGFKSIRELKDFELSKKLNVLIGANGAGKSNFISLFRMLASMMDEQLQDYVGGEEGPDALLFDGRKRTREISVELYFRDNGYLFSLKPAGRRLVFSKEQTYFKGDFTTATPSLGKGHGEAILPTLKQNKIANYVLPTIRSWQVFHFHDTSPLAGVRNAQRVRDNLLLKYDASNLAPFLRMLRQKHEASYKTIVDTIRMVAPFFHDFVYREEVGPDDLIDLEWREVGDRKTPRGPRQLSDGTLRFICLATLLLQPERFQPSMIIIDEPELGLHPYALVVLGALLQRAGDLRQVVVSTQSAELVNQLDPADVIVVQRHEGASVFERLDAKALEHWLKDDYALGELWKMNVVGGGLPR